jgi:hypothetical protein
MNGSNFNKYFNDFLNKTLTNKVLMSLEFWARWSGGKFYIGDVDTYVSDLGVWEIEGKKFDATMIKDTTRSTQENSCRVILAEQWEESRLERTKTSCMGSSYFLPKIFVFIAKEDTKKGSCPQLKTISELKEYFEKDTIGGFYEYYPLIRPKTYITGSPEYDLNPAGTHDRVYTLYSLMVDLERLSFDLEDGKIEGNVEEIKVFPRKTYEEYEEEEEKRNKETDEWFKNRKEPSPEAIKKALSSKLGKSLMKIYEEAKEKNK